MRDKFSSLNSIGRIKVVTVAFLLWLFLGYATKDDGRMKIESSVSSEYDEFDDAYNDLPEDDLPEDEFSDIQSDDELEDIEE